MQRTLVLGGGLFVGVRLHRAVAGPAGVRLGLDAVGGTGGLGEVPAELRQVAVGAGAVQPLDRLAADLAVEVAGTGSRFEAGERGLVRGPSGNDDEAAATGREVLLATQ